MNSERALLFDWKETEVLITGGTGSLGKTITKTLLTKYRPKGIRIYSRDEFKQWQMKNELEAEGYKGNVSFLIGDVRDKNRLDRALNKVNLVFNTAAMKHVPACEYNQIEAVKTNIHGSENIIDCAIDNGVSLVMHVSTDKAVYPVNLYGSTKTVAEKLFLHGNNYAGGHGTKFSVCRYGNVIGSRGSIIPLFVEQVKKGIITLTDKRMTRFWITLQKVADFIIHNSMITTGNEIFIPVMPSIRITDLTDATIQVVNSEFFIQIQEIGIRKGEKLHECLISEEESVFAIKQMDLFVINESGGEQSERFSYTSDANKFLTIDEIKQYIIPFMEESK